MRIRVPGEGGGAPWRKVAMARVTRYTHRVFGPRVLGYPGAWIPELNKSGYPDTRYKGYPV